MNPELYACDFPDTGNATGRLVAGALRKRKGHKLSECVGVANAPDQYGDGGSAARFFIQITENK